MTATIIGTIEKSFTIPSVAPMPLLLSLSDKEPIFEFACHEGKHSMQGILAGARPDAAEAVGCQGQLAPARGIRAERPVPGAGLASPAKGPGE